MGKDEGRHARMDEGGEERKGKRQLGKGEKGDREEGRERWMDEEESPKLMREERMREGEEMGKKDGRRRGSIRNKENGEKKQEMI